MTIDPKDKVLGEFSDGSLTQRDAETIMDEVRSGKDFLSPHAYASLGNKIKTDGNSAITRKEYVQCCEYTVFQATGTTRD